MLAQLYSTPILNQMAFVSKFKIGWKGGDE